MPDRDKVFIVTYTSRPGSHEFNHFVLGVTHTEHGFRQIAHDYWERLADGARTLLEKPQVGWWAEHPEQYRAHMRGAQQRSEACDIHALECLQVRLPEKWVIDWGVSDESIEATEYEVRD